MVVTWTQHRTNKIITLDIELTWKALLNLKGRRKDKEKKLKASPLILERKKYLETLQAFISYKLKNEI